MKASRLLVLIIALGAGGLAAWLNLSSGSREQTPTIVVQEQEVPSLEILVAAKASRSALHLQTVIWSGQSGLRTPYPKVSSYAAPTHRQIRNFLGKL